MLQEEIFDGEVKDRLELGPDEREAFVVEVEGEFLGEGLEPLHNEEGQGFEVRAGEVSVEVRGLVVLEPSKDVLVELRDEFRSILEAEFVVLVVLDVGQVEEWKC